MRPLRLFLSLLISLILVTSLLYLSISTDPDQDVDSGRPGQPRPPLRSYFFFHNPALLFTSAATISLTDDNSTYFAARPAAFGPQLPLRGISGQLWVGSGFGDDNLDRRGMLAGVEGELGCSDIPGWSNHDWRLADETYEGSSGDKEAENEMKHSNTHGGRDAPKPCQSITSEPSDLQPDAPHPDDGTDDYLHFPLPGTSISTNVNANTKHSGGSSREHADILSIQESAEISGKIVILSRGGCGFSEKVQWAQRRGATGVIIGDNVLGGALVRMYAQGDAANITIPSLFTSHMSAHLLSSLIPSRRNKDRAASTAQWEWVDDHAPNLPQDKKLSTSTLDTESTVARSSLRISHGIISSSASRTVHQADDSVDGTSIAARKDSSRPGWIRSSLTAVGFRKASSPDLNDDISRRPPHSGQLEWSSGNYLSDERIAARQDVTASRQDSDDFIIGIQDWRDPDVIHGIDDLARLTYSSTSSVATASATGRSMKISLKGGSITPGSGEYENLVDDHSQPEDYYSSQGLGGHSAREKDGDHVIDVEDWNDIHHVHEEKVNNARSSNARLRLDMNSGKLITSPLTGATKSRQSLVRDPLLSEGTGREGLWVTLTPVDMSASPFFNTLFVLVVSPLITLAIVYSMLLIRSRIRRRRWRAPKSLVERLPVHVYHRLSRSGSSSVPETTNMTSTTATTPLLSHSRPTDIGARPCAQTTDAAAASSHSSSGYGSIESASPDHEKEKMNSGLAEWKRKYKGKQVECVVCLEEYIDGVSRVMSLPCGHEFHVDCITPWLTTRRRTCPICKGDVVRSMDRPLSSGRIASANDMTEEQIQEQAGETTNTAPSSALPIPHDDINSEIDVEQARHESTSDEQGSSWISRRIGRRLGFRGTQPTEGRPRSSTGNRS